MGGGRWVSAASAASGGGSAARPRSFNRKRTSLDSQRYIGRVLEWKSRFGWIAPDTMINHPEAKKHRGRIYVNVSDLAWNVTVTRGTRVSFLVYTDGDGVGAEDVQIVEEGEGGFPGDYPPAEFPGVFPGPPDFPPPEYPPEYEQGHEGAAGSNAGPGFKGRSRRGRTRSEGRRGGVMRSIQKIPARGLRKIPARGEPGGRMLEKGKGARKGGREEARYGGKGEPWKGGGKDEPAWEPWEGQDEPRKGGGKDDGKGKGGGGCAGGGGGGGGGGVTLVPGPNGSPDRNKVRSRGSGKVLTWAASEMRGWRSTMEDATRALLVLGAPLEYTAFFGVFDGHGGAAVSRRVAEALPTEVVECAGSMCNTTNPRELHHHALAMALPRMDDQLREAGWHLQSEEMDGTAISMPMGGNSNNAFDLTGSTAVVALLECNGPPALGHALRVTVANCGDSRALLCRRGQAIQLTEDQKPDVPEERDRIERAGGFVAPVGPCQRIDGWGLNLSRALGDFYYKSRHDLPYTDQKVVAVPEIRSCDLTEADEFLLLCCDGVFELKSSQEAVDTVRNALMAGKTPHESVDELVDACCSPDLFQTRGLGSDNVSAMLILLQ